MIIKTLLVLAMSIAGISLSAQCCKIKTKETTAVMAADANAVAVKLPKLLDFGAKQCIPCKAMAPILDELTKEYTGIMNVEFVDVTIPENEDLAIQYKIEIIPTQIFLDANGKELWRHQNFISKEDILAKWKALGYDLENLKKDKPAVKDAK